MDAVVKLGELQGMEGAVILSIDYGERKGGVFMLTEGRHPAYIGPGKNASFNAAGLQIRFNEIRPRGEDPEIHIYREAPIQKDFPEIYRRLSSGERVTAETLKRLSVLRGGGN